MKSLITTALLVPLLGALPASAQTWSFHYTGNTADLVEIQFPSATTGYIATSFGVRKTTDAGATWAAGGLTTGAYSSVSFLNNDTGWVVGGGGDIRKTVNGGGAWTSQAANGGGTVDLRSVAFATATHGFAARGASNTSANFIRTTDGGTTWTLHPIGAAVVSNNNIWKVQFASASVGYVVGNIGVYKTVDMGATWTNVFAGVWPGRLMAVDFTSPDTGYVAGDSGKVFKTVNGGAAWTAVVSDSLSGLHFTDLDCVNARLCYLSGTGNGTSSAIAAGGYVYKTSNGGASWERNLYLGTSGFHAIAFPTASLGFVSGTGGTIRKTDAVSAVSPAASASAGALRLSRSGAAWNLGFSLERAGTVSLSLVDLSGKRVWTSEFHAAAGAQSVALPASALSGARVLDFRSGEGRQTRVIAGENAR